MKHKITQEEKFQMMTTAPIPSLIGKMAVPTIISMLITSIYNIADTFFVSRLGTSATASVGIVFPVMAIIQALGFFFGHGSGNSISRRLGAKDTERAEQLAGIGFFSAFLCGLCVTVLGLLFLEPLSLLLGSTSTILPYTKDYLGIILLGAPYTTAQLVLNNQLRFQGNAFYAMIGITSGGILNIFLDPLFIFKFNMGVSGAALATILSQFVSFLLLLWGIKISGCIPLKLKSMKYLKYNLKIIAQGGLPSLFRQGLGSISILALNLAANPYGDAAIAAMSIVSRISQFAISALIGFGQGFQPVCGFNYGAKKFSRVREAFWFCVKVSTVVLIFIGITGFLFAGSLISVFRKDDLQVIVIGTVALRMQCVALPLSGWVIMNNMMTQTIGKTFKASLLAAARQGIFFVPAVLVLPPLLGILGIQMAQPVADICAFLLAVVINRSIMKEMKEEEKAYE